MNWDGQNRRRFPRVVYPCLVKIDGKDGQSKVVLTHTENLSLGGAGIVIKQEVKLFSDVVLEIDLLDAEDHVKITGKVVWVVRRKQDHPVKPLFYDVGIEFVKISDKHKEHLVCMLDRLIKNGATILKSPG